MQDFIVIGGGIVGTATALKIKEKRPDAKVLLLEKEGRLAHHQTGNNSGVIHSGIYYKPGSLKAKNCALGYRLLLDFCQEHDVRHEVCGKLIVAATPDELPRLEAIRERGIANGLAGLELLGPEEIREREPHCQGLQAIFVPQTGIVDFRGMCQKMGDTFVQLGGEILFHTEVIDIKNDRRSAIVISRGGVFEARHVVVCAGLQADRLARTTHPRLDFAVIPFRGEYYKLKPEHENLVKHLIYPVPNPAFPFLGVHFTRMALGGIEAGPNAVFAFKREGYKNTQISIPDMVEAISWPGFRKVVRKHWRMGLEEMGRSFSKDKFVDALRRLIPEIGPEHLEKGGAGVRAQACDSNGELIDDFWIFHDHRVTHVCNAPSPAATSSLAIGESLANDLLKS